MPLMFPIDCGAVTKSRFALSAMMVGSPRLVDDGMTTGAVKPFAAVPPYGPAACAVSGDAPTCQWAVRGWSRYCRRRRAAPAPMKRTPTPINAAVHGVSGTGVPNPLPAKLKQQMPSIWRGS